MASLSATARRGAWLALALLYLTPLSAAYNFSRVAEDDSWFASDKTNFSDKGPHGIPGDELTNATAHPNATGTFPVTGPKLGGGDGSNSTFELKIEVTADVSLENAQHVSFLDSGKTSAITALRFGGKSLSEADASDWSICALVFSGVEWSRMMAAQDDDGSCSLAFGNDQCAADLGEAITEIVRSRNSCNNDAPPIPESCRDALFERESETGFALWGNKFNLRDLEEDSRFLMYGAVPARKGQEGRFEEAVANIWPTLLIFRNKGNSSSDSDSDGSGAEETDFHVMRCPRAKNVVAQAVAVSPSATRSASPDKKSLAIPTVLSRSSAWIMMITALPALVLYNI